MVRWVVGSILHGVNPLSYFSFQPVLHNWCNKGCGMCYPVCGMVHIKEPLLLIGNSSPCGGSGFTLSLSEWSFTIYPTPYNRKIKCLSASLNKTFPSFLPLYELWYLKICIRIIRLVYAGLCYQRFLLLLPEAVPDGIAIDSVSRLIFYTDTGNDIIAVMSIDGFAHKTIISHGLDEPRAIVTDFNDG